MIAAYAPHGLVAAAQPASVRRVPAADARRIRHAVLRPGDPRDAVIYEDDDALGTVHLGSFEGAWLVAVASAVHRAPPGSADPRSWCLCGVATLGAVRGHGHGRELVRAVLAHVARRGGLVLWCNARVTALGFYERCGFRSDLGAGAQAAAGGSHVQMRRLVDGGGDLSVPLVTDVFEEWRSA